MSEKPKQTYNYIVDIIEKIKKIKSKIKNINVEEFKKNSDLQEIIEYNLLIIGEAVSKIPIEILIKYNEEQFYWRQIKDMRNFLIHQYWGVSLEMVYQVAVNDILELESYINEMIKNEKPE